MGRVWHRLGAVVFAVSLVVVFSQCKALKGLKPAPGAPCMIGNNKFQCNDASSALLCQNGKWVPMPCRGPAGCSASGTFQRCDDDLSLEGDACMMSLNDNYSCSVDHTKELICKDGKFVTVRACKGPKKCTVTTGATNDSISCDDSMGDVGDVCKVEAGDDNYGCTTDKKIEVVCDGPTSKFAPSQSCRGPKGCYIEGTSVYCDRTLARINDKCRHPDDHACSEDATQMLKCSPQFTWLKQRDCKHGGCKVKGNQVDCE